MHVLSYHFHTFGVKLEIDMAYEFLLSYSMFEN